MNFDLSIFPTIGKFLFDIGVKIYKALDFNFGSFTVNGWVLLIGIAVFCIVLHFISRILD